MATPPVAFPLTYDPVAQSPAYAAKDLRLTMGAASAIPDGSAFNGIQGVRAGSPSPLARISGTTVTVAAHMGWLSPWAGTGVYTYALPVPVQVAVPSTSGSYKIAVVLEDKASGHGAGEQVTVQAYPASTLDSQIPGLVIARVVSGVASDAAPVISQDTTVRVSTLAQLQTIKAAEGTRGVVAAGGEYRMVSGSWSPTVLGGYFTGATDGNGMVKIKVPSQPSQVLLQTATIGDDNRRFWRPVVWQSTATEVTIRVVDTRTNGWAGVQPARFFWRMYF